jgi:hypothetical protein
MIIARAPRLDVRREVCKGLLHRGLYRLPAKTFEPNISVICQRIFMKFKMQIF